MPGDDDHYLPFSDVFGQNTSEMHRPSINKKQAVDSGSKQKSLPFYATVQHVKNTGLVVQCEECQMWRIVFSKYKLTAEQQVRLNKVLDGFVWYVTLNMQDFP